VQRIDLAEGGFLLHEPRLLSESEAEAAFSGLVGEVPFRQETIRLFGKEILQPRLSAWYGDPEAVYTYSGLTLAPLPWSPRLSELRARVEAAAGQRFNSVLINYYRSGEDSMGMHADDEPELGKNPIIASLSLGAARTFVLRPQKKSMAPPSKLELELESGSLLVMAGTTQHHYRHGVPKQPGRGPRINLTFRLLRHDPERASGPKS